jgi:tripartite-type tricarboxylate transporter receptor subunit TctC
MMIKSLHAAAFAGLVGALVSASTASADAVTDFYKGKNVNIVVGYAAGGGADLWSRFLARHIGRYIPGEPNVIVQNMPGAGGFRAVNHVYNAGPQDGTYILLPTTSAISAPSMGVPNVRWDVFKFQWLGNLTRDVSGCVASDRSGIKSIKEAETKEIVFGADGMDDPASHVPRALANVLGYKTRVIAGYKGTGPAFLALEIGEIDARCSFWASQALSSKKQDVDSGKLVPILQMGSEKHPVFGSAPSIYDLARNEEEEKIMRFLFGPTEISRPFAAPPGVPAERVAALREAFWKAAKSPELLAEAERLKLIIDPMDWQETEAALRAALDMPQSVIDRAKDAIGNR